VAVELIELEDGANNCNILPFAMPQTFTSPSGAALPDGSGVLLCGGEVFQ